jgi:hypothetical protein
MLEPMADAKARKRNKLTEAGDAAARVAKRNMLLLACDACDWSLAAVATLLGMASSADVIRALKELAPAEYAAAQADGRVSRQNRT